MDQQKNIFSNFPGFTLIEVLLSVVIIGALAGLSVPVYQSFQVKNDLEIGADTVAQALRRAQILAQASEGDSMWGVKVQSGTVILFKGTSFAARDTAADEATSLVPTIVPSGNTEFVFSKMSGLPSLAGNLTLTSANGDIRNLTINPKGFVSY